MESACSSNPASSEFPVTLNDFTTITGTLASLLSKAYGPRGQLTLLVSSTGQTSVVKNGLEILSSLHLSHPVAKVIFQATKNLFDSNGDGCKTMILYINALMSALKRETAKCTLLVRSNPCLQQNEMSKALHLFCNRTLPVLLSKVEHYLNLEMKEALGNKDVSWILLHVISTYLNGSVPHEAIQPIAELVVQYLNKGSCGFNDYCESVKWFSSCVFMCPNKPYSLSCLKSGVFLHHPLHNADNNKTSPTNMVCLMCSLDGMPSKSDGRDSCLLSDPNTLIEHRHKVIKNFLSSMQDKKVELIVCSSNIPSFALHVCQMCGIAVIHCVEDSDINFLCHITGKSPLNSCFEDVHSSCVMKVSSFTQIVDGCSTYSSIIFEEDLEWKPRSLFLCAPSEAFAKQLKKTVEKCLIVASDMLKVSDHSNNDCQALKNVVCGGGYFEMVLCKFLSDYINENGSSMQAWCCHVVSEMLMAPIQILYDSYSCQPHKKQGLLHYLPFTRARMKCENIPGGLDAKCHISPLLGSGVIDVLSTKIAILYSALSVALCLLNVESILSVNKPCLPPQ